jgi:hypothetical protein
VSPFTEQSVIGTPLMLPSVESSTKPGGSGDPATILNVRFAVSGGLEPATTLVDLYGSVFTACVNLNNFKKTAGVLADGELLQMA